jgi:hypothetical protein
MRIWRNKEKDFSLSMMAGKYTTGLLYMSEATDFGRVRCSDGSCPSADAARENPLQMLPWAIENPQSPQKRSLRARSMAASVMFSQGNARHYLDARLLSDKHVNSVSQSTLAAALDKAMVNITGVNYRGFLYGGGEQAKPAKDAMGLLPAWRDATYHFIVNAVPGSIRRDYSIAPIAKLFPDAGGYVNEVSVWTGSGKAMADMTNF